MSLPVIVPDWSAASSVRALVTTRAGGISPAPFDSLNLGQHVNDLPENVRANRQRLRSLLPAEPLWLEQVHGITVRDAGLSGSNQADAVVSRQVGVVCAVMTADCLPVLFADRAGTVVGAAHAGWRGLCAGVLEACVAAMRAAPQDIIAWLGPAIGPRRFEVGPEVREAFIRHDEAAAAAFTAGREDRLMADIFMLARQRLAAIGIQETAIFGGDLCTVSDAQRFFSWRRDGATGRMASLIWLNQAEV